ncbi:MAG: hypothetical protein A2079_04085 [Geobacteraceae bacterium GWC2_48_7]|nr:MAG: hypothetical protein A2379_04970 [Candidatus Amesbacteria bacterium RIFOXYB1_FULL_47_13]OGT98809.1 MAG: hypothetical protein A2079_04085 [Geobacteraceae bacterium GWC2_48_7]HBC72460.1 hypothetical protein [Candidatus Amesbacteria bacterium]
MGERKPVWGVDERYGPDASNDQAVVQLKRVWPDGGEEAGLMLVKKVAKRRKERWLRGGDGKYRVLQEIRR